MTTKANLARDIANCQLCAGLLPDPPKPILQLGFNAPILIAGQAPGRLTRVRGLAFDDASGDRLRAWLGVTREQFYNPSLFSILPMGFCYPGTGTNGDLAPRAECAAHWRRKVLIQHEGLALQLVIGHYAQQWHLNSQTNLTETVRNWRAFWPAALPLPHPSPRNNRWLKANPWFAEQVLPELQAQVTRLLAGRAGLY
ncbi:uracil-DNA glycosylase family protein [Simiduia curdlanivorans]|uniref:Uracil-DNA glycosylase family protein n=1 Tax=Simiduia curdlanivorans TaxID=1492769 RepID=A0ABV8V6A9_9GAMM|nr:uracil-DNA glycosylase family protein [Simiduia curdlanivorans]MDN3638604.1 uracil-DNA glycosylase family protein [Simiduia curdlanivorans]